jgi:hypothetical protein
MFDTATADRAPDRMPAMTAIAITGSAPGPRREGVAATAAGGRLVQAGAACQPGA